MKGQIMSSSHIQRDELDEYLVEVLSHQLEPPRDISVRKLLRLVILKKEVASLAFLSLGALAFALYLNTKSSIPSEGVSTSDRYLRNGLKTINHEPTS